MALGSVGSQGVTLDLPCIPFECTGLIFHLKFSSLRSQKPQTLPMDPRTGHLPQYYGLLGLQFPRALSHYHLLIWLDFSLTYFSLEILFALLSAQYFQSYVCENFSRMYLHISLSSIFLPYFYSDSLLFLNKHSLKNSFNHLVLLCAKLVMSGENVYFELY